MYLIFGSKIDPEPDTLAVASKNVIFSHAAFFVLLLTPPEVDFPL